MSTKTHLTSLTTCNV